MNTKTVNSEELEILQVVRGQKDWAVLQTFGLNINFDENGMCHVTGKGARVVGPTIRDIAEGFARHQSDPRALKQWAAVIMAASAIIDLVKVEEDYAGNLLLDALWNAAYDEPIDQDAKDLIVKLTRN